MIAFNCPWTGALLLCGFQEMKAPLAKIVSGGQTGADRAALEWALGKGVPTGGWCPKDRKAEDGRIPDCFPMQETPTGDYLQRNEWNVRDSDGTVIFTIAREITGGSLRTLGFCQKLEKPVLHLSRERENGNAPRFLAEFLRSNRIAVLNVAGSRGSKEPELADWVKDVLSEWIGQHSTKR